MNWRHLQVFVWLRWRLLANQWRRAGRLNAILMGIICVAAVIMVIPLFIGTFVLATNLIPKATPLYLMLAWDGLIFFFLLFWGVGLLTELQRNDPLSLSKFMHLPVSPNGAFLINYLSSLMRLSLLFFGPLMLGLALAMIYVNGLSQLAVLPLLAAFLLMITGLTYQFQGWLASLMSDPRRRRTIVVGTTAAFVLIFQLPNLLNLYAPWGAMQRSSRVSVLPEEMAKLQHAYNAKEIDAKELERRMRELAENDKFAKEVASRKKLESFTTTAKIVNTILPAGWLPLGVMSSAEGRFLPVFLSLLGMTSIGTVSLWRAYRTTVGQYQGQSSNRKALRATPVTTAIAMERTPTAGVRKPRALLLEARIPGLTEPVSGIALGGFRSLLRSPEAKMTLLTPIIMCGVFGSMMLKGGQNFSESLRPLAGIGGIAMVLLGVLQMASNQFGVDRDGFRVFVLCAAPRRDILLGKNLAFAPLALGMSTLLVLAIQAFCPMRLDHFLSMFPLMISMFLLFCLFANLVSIMTPVYMPPGSFKAVSPKTTTVLLQIAMFLVLFPLSQAPAFLPLGAEMLSKFLGWTENAPICLLLSLAECAVVVLIYRVVLVWEGEALQYREQRILETVTNRAI